MQLLKRPSHGIPRTIFNRENGNVAFCDLTNVWKQLFYMTLCTTVHYGLIAVVSK